MGDLLFAAVNLARHLKVDPETALRSANAKFERRFAHIETRLAESGQTPETSSLDEMERLWVEAKNQERLAHQISRRLSQVRAATEAPSKPLFDRIRTLASVGPAPPEYTSLIGASRDPATRTRRRRMVITSMLLGEL